jgi:hypothetical protein
MRATKAQQRSAVSFTDLMHALLALEPSPERPLAGSDVAPRLAGLPALLDPLPRSARRTRRRASMKSRAAASG